MSTTEIEQKIMNTIRQIKSSEIQMNENSRIFGDLGFDSLSFMEFVVSLETEFGIKLEELVTADDEDFTIRSLARFVNKD